MTVTIDLTAKTDIITIAATVATTAITATIITTCITTATAIMATTVWNLLYDISA